MVRLLYRFFEPQSRSIFIGGQNINEVDLDSLLKSIAIVPQDSVLFHNTIKYNINYGNLSKSQADVEKAAKMADIHDSILNWPHGYETQVNLIYLFLNHLLIVEQFYRLVNVVLNYLVERSKE